MSYCCPWLEAANSFWPVLAKVTLLLGFTIAGYNLDRIRSYRAKKRAEAETKPAQPKRRRGTWEEVVEATEVREERGGSPPT